MGLSLALTPLCVTAQTSPFDNGTSRTSIAQTRSADPLLPPGQVHGNYRNYLSKRYSNDREAHALLHMAKRKRTWGVIWSIVGGVNTIRLFGGYEPVTTTQNGVTVTTQTSPVGNIVFAGLGWSLGISRLTRYSNGALYRAMQQHDAGHSWAPYFDNNIKDKDYDR